MATEETPSIALTKRVIERLLTDKLLTEEEAKKLSPKIALGSATQPDWKLAAENSIEREKKS